jgi:hypothetical protein
MARLKSCPDTKQSFSAVRKVVSPRKIEFSRRLFSPYLRTEEFSGQKKRTSAAKAGYGRVVYGTAEAVPFLKTEFSRRL